MLIFERSSMDFSRRLRASRNSILCRIFSMAALICSTVSRSSLVKSGSGTGSGAIGFLLAKCAPYRCHNLHPNVLLAAITAKATGDLAQPVQPRYQLVTDPRRIVMSWTFATKSAVYDSGFTLNDE